MNLTEELIEYSEAVLSGEIVSCQKHKWACQRFLNDIANQGTEGFPFVFVEEKAERFLDWMRLFKHRKGVLKANTSNRISSGNLYLETSTGGFIKTLATGDSAKPTGKLDVKMQNPNH